MLSVCSQSGIISFVDCYFFVKSIINNFNALIFWIFSERIDHISIPAIQFYWQFVSNSLKDNKTLKL